MTTEQMDWLDDERAGRHNYVGVTPESLVKDAGRSHWPFTPNPDDSVKPDFYEQMELARRDVADYMGVPIEAIQITLNHDVAEDRTHHTREPIEVGLKPGTEYHVRVNGGEPTVMTTDAEDHTHHTREARDQCAAGDHKYARLLDEAAEREKIKAHEPPPGWFYFGTHAGVDVKLEFSEAQDEVGDPLWERPIHSVSAEDYVTMAEEPIEDRLRRAWLNGYTDGFSEGFNRAAYQTNWER